MDLSDRKEHLEFRQEVRAFIAAHRHRVPKVSGQSYRMHPRPFAPDMVAWQTLLVENGLASRTVPTEYGGYGAEPDILKSRIIADEFFAAGVPMGLENQGVSMLVPTLLEHGTEQQKQDWVARTIRGEIFWCQGYSEPGAGSDLASLQTRAVDDGDDFIINGQKIWTSSAHIAQMIFCLVRTEPDAPKHKGISYLIFPMDLPGIEVRPLQTMTGHPSFNETFFTDVCVPKTALVGPRGAGWQVANSTLKHERGMLGNANSSQWRLNRIREMMGRHGPAGQKVSASPVHRNRFIELQARVQSLRAHEMRLVTGAARGQPPGLGDMVCKLLTCEVNYALDLFAIDLQGELGVEYDKYSGLDDDGIWQQLSMYDLGLIIGGGTAQIQKNIISERGLGMPREPRLTEVAGG